MPEFPRHDPADPQFWDLRYQASFAPWDAGRVPAQLAQFAKDPRGRVLVPGCGSAWDVRCFVESGWDVLGIDFSQEALAAARAVLGPHAERVRHADFFAPIPESPFDAVYERAFLCALPRRLWSAWSARVSELVNPYGHLVGFFYFDAGGAPNGDSIRTAVRGPPFPLRDDAELAGLLASTFTRIVDAPVPDSIPIFQGKERWQVWQRR